MPAESRPPPGRAAVEAVNPTDGRRWEVYLRESKIAATAKRGMGAAKELAHPSRRAPARAWIQD
jgi:hypothetical protein